MTSRPYRPMPSPSLQRLPRPLEIPLSFAQQRLWILSRLERDSASYNVPMAIRLAGNLDHRVLKRAIGDVVERHEALRTVFPEKDGTPRQQVVEAQDAQPDLVLVQTSKACLDAHLAMAAAAPFDLCRELPIRAYLFELEPFDHVLLLVIHHIATDGWSMQRVLRPELARTYSARFHRRLPDWAELPIQYADYAVWERRMFASDEGASNRAGQLRYWAEALAGLPDEINLPVDRARARRTSYRAERAFASINPALHRDIVALARAEEATPFMVLHAALAALLTRLGAGTDIPIGTAFAGRSDRLLEGLVGCFVNTLVLRTDTSADPTFRSLLRRVRLADFAAYAHSDVPFDRLVKTTKPARSLARNPLFQVMMLAPTLERVVTPWAGLDATPHAVDSGLTNFDLTFTFWTLRDADGNLDGMRVIVEYSQDLFERDTAEHLAACFCELLQQVIADPNRTLADVAGPWRPRVPSVVAPPTAPVPPVPRIGGEPTPEEIVFYRLCAELLAVEGIVRTDNFFDMGGDSLVATRLVNRVRTTFGVELPAAAVFDAACFGDLFAYVRYG